jgi:hypothetical protein
MYLHDATDDSAIREHVEIVVIPFAGRPACCGAFEDQVILVHLATNGAADGWVRH